MTFNPKINMRGKYKFAEFVTALGPQTIGVTGDNSYTTLFGREWLLVLDRQTNYLHLYQESDTVEGEWNEVTVGVPPQLFGAPLPENARRISFCFDQSARLNAAYEIDGHVEVTRWDSLQGAYLPNVDFEGHDPQLLMDATWTYYIPDSDVLLFYLDSSRLNLYCRVQRETYSIEHLIYTFSESVMLDHGVSLFAKYQLMYANTEGEPIENASVIQALISELYPVRAYTPVDVSVYHNELGTYAKFRELYTDSELNALSIPVEHEGFGAYTLLKALYTADDLDEMSVAVEHETLGLYDRIKTLYEDDDLDELSIVAEHETLGLYDKFRVFHVGDDLNAVSVPCSHSSLGSYDEI